MGDALITRRGGNSKDIVDRINEKSNARAWVAQETYSERIYISKGAPYTHDFQIKVDYSSNPLYPSNGQPVEGVIIISFTGNVAAGKYNFPIKYQYGEEVKSTFEYDMSDGFVKLTATASVITTSSSSAWYVRITITNDDSTTSAVNPLYQGTSYAIHRYITY